MKNIITIKKDDKDFIKCYEDYKNTYHPSRSQKQRKTQKDMIMYGALHKYFELKNINQYLPGKVTELKKCYHVQLKIKWWC